MDLTFQCFTFLIFVNLFFFSHVSATSVFSVQHRFAGKKSSLQDLKSHDNRRHGRILAEIDVPMGGIGDPTQTGLYYAQIGLGNPSKNYYVQVDTGSDILWVNCIQCTRCPRKSGLGVELTLYDPKESSSGSLVGCSDPFCSIAFQGPLPGCTPNVLCQYSVQYGDGSTTSGYYVQDFVEYEQVTGNFQTTASNASIVFGCGAVQSGGLGSEAQALDGILGFGQSNSSLISQLASSGKVKKMFAHCLDGDNGGGIFAIGHVVQPTMAMTPLVPNKPHYNVKMNAIEVGSSVLQLPSDVFDSGDNKGTIVDSGTTLAYLAEEAYHPLMLAIKSGGPNVTYYTFEGSLCFDYTGSVDEAFPSVTLHFEVSVSLAVAPHEYLFQVAKNSYCFGWQNSGVQAKESKDMTILGDFVLANKLVFYDLENQVIGWTKYNCSSNIKVKDDKTGAVYTIGAHNLSFASSLNFGRLRAFLLLLTVMLLQVI